MEEIEAQIEEIEETESEEDMDIQPLVPHTGLPDILVVQEGDNEDTEQVTNGKEETGAEKDNLNNLAKDNQLIQQSKQNQEKHELKKDQDPSQVCLNS